MGPLGQVTPSKAQAFRRREGVGQVYTLIRHKLIQLDNTKTRTHNGQGCRSLKKENRVCAWPVPLFLSSDLHCLPKLKTTGAGVFPGASTAARILTGSGSK